ncbi:MAG: ribbon-helix-helix domain-containing protein [Methanobrevibacter sp.]|jgi:metal-responsive CopG/Arc/MetJ family transcriptional regulator|nr:ribbon-helix-helix domain-containing protein [Candidatus Methanoflexus mossambicus]
MTNNFKRTTIYIQNDVINNLKRIAIEKDKNQSELIREYIKTGMEKDKNYLKRYAI